MKCQVLIHVQKERQRIRTKQGGESYHILNHCPRRPRNLVLGFLSTGTIASTFAIVCERNKGSLSQWVKTRESVSPTALMWYLNRIWSKFVKNGSILNALFKKEESETLLSTSKARKRLIVRPPHKGATWVQTVTLQGDKNKIHLNNPPYINRSLKKFVSKFSSPPRSNVARAKF